jgi:hypothetical protein
MILPNEAADVLVPLAPAFTEPTFRRFNLLLLAALLTPGRHTVANLLRTLGAPADGRRTSFQRVFSAASWPALRLARLLARQLIRWLTPDTPIALVGDDTVDGHKGKKVHGKARHRDPVRSSHSYTAWRYGHKWVVRAVLIRLPFAGRPWALPVLVDLYRGEQDNRNRKRRHRTPAQLRCRLLRLMLLWLPDRRFVFVGDAGYGTHEVARFCRRHRGRLTPVSQLHPDANLFEPPPPYAGKGRPRAQGAALSKPRQAAAAATLERLGVSWYGGGVRQVDAAGGTGCGYKSGCGLVPLRRVSVKGATGAHRDEYFFTTDPDLAAATIIGHYTARWDIEATPQEMRGHLGLETARGWCEKTVLRAAPCLFGLYGVVALLYAALPGSKRSGGVEWPGKATVTFSGALTAVRRWLWSAWVSRQDEGDSALEKLPEPLRNIIFAVLAPAA